MAKKTVLPSSGDTPPHETPASGLMKVLLDFVSEIPSTGERTSGEPGKRAREIASAAAVKAAMVSGTLSLPPGPLGWATVLPDLIAVWKIQAQMVADIAGAFGKQAYLTREQMLYCLFRHAAAQAVRDLVVRVGERLLVRRVSLRTLQSVARKVGVRITQRLLGRGISRWLPIVGALGVAGYAYYDTGRVADTAIDFFGGDIGFAEEGTDRPSGGPVGNGGSGAVPEPEVEPL